MDELLGKIDAHADILDEMSEKITSLKSEIAGIYQQLAWYWFTYGTCACGARSESLDTHPHTIGCPTEEAFIKAVIGSRT